MGCHKRCINQKGFCTQIRKKPMKVGFVLYVNEKIEMSLSWALSCMCVRKRKWADLYIACIHAAVLLSLFLSSLCLAVCSIMCLYMYLCMYE